MIMQKAKTLSYILTITLTLLPGTLVCAGASADVVWDDNGFGQTNIPSGLSNVVAISAGRLHSLALTAEGEVVGWGYNAYGQTNIPGGLSNVVAISGGEYHTQIERFLRPKRSSAD